MRIKDVGEGDDLIRQISVKKGKEGLVVSIGNLMKEGSVTAELEAC